MLGTVQRPRTEWAGEAPQWSRGATGTYQRHEDCFRAIVFCQHYLNTSNDGIAEQYRASSASNHATKLTQLRGIPISLDYWISMNETEPSPALFTTLNSGEMPEK